MSDEPASTVTGPQKAAPEHPVPSQHFYAVEFPGVVQDESVDRAIEHLGGQRAIDRAFKRNASKADSMLELNWRPGDPFSHPVPGGVDHANNILLKVTKRKRKRKNGEELAVPEGEFVAEAVGVIPKTIRFRSTSKAYYTIQLSLTYSAGMADFQYSPEASDPVVQFRSAMDRMDGKCSLTIIYMCIVFDSVHS